MNAFSPSLSLMPSYPTTIKPRTPTDDLYKLMSFSPVTQTNTASTASANTSGGLASVPVNTGTTSTQTSAPAPNVNLAPAPNSTQTDTTVLNKPFTGTAPATTQAPATAYLGNYSGTGGVGSYTPKTDSSISPITSSQINSSSNTQGGTSTPSSTTSGGTAVPSGASSEYYQQLINELSRQIETAGSRDAQADSYNQATVDYRNNLLDFLSPLMSGQRLPGIFSEIGAPYSQEVFNANFNNYFNPLKEKMNSLGLFNSGAMDAMVGEMANNVLAESAENQRAGLEFLANMLMGAPMNFMQAQAPTSPSIQGDITQLLDLNRLSENDAFGRLMGMKEYNLDRSRFLADQAEKAYNRKLLEDQLAEEKRNSMFSSTGMNNSALDLLNSNPFFNTFNTLNQIDLIQDKLKTPYSLNPFSPSVFQDAQNFGEAIGIFNSLNGNYSPGSVADLMNAQANLGNAAAKLNATNKRDNSVTERAGSDGSLYRYNDGQLIGIDKPNRWNTGKDDKDGANPTNITAGGR